MSTATGPVVSSGVQLFDLKRTAFVLWRPHRTQPAPELVIGEFEPGNPPTLKSPRKFKLESSPGIADLWQIDASRCELIEGHVYHYWFEVSDSSPSSDGGPIACADPTAFSVDWRLIRGSSPASVVKFENGELVSCDPDGARAARAPRIAPAEARANNQTVVYELPTSWARVNVHGDSQVGVGTFRDVRALVDESVAGANFSESSTLREGRSHLVELGVNALELLPPADSFVEREWGYATSNYFAPDYDLGFPAGNASPSANADLVDLVAACHRGGIRFIADMVMAFGTRAATEHVNFPDFHVDPSADRDDPDAKQSGDQGVRNGFGGCLWRYARPVLAYDPVAGMSNSIYPARQFMKAFLLRWMSDFAIDGVRMDSVNNIANWDFVEEFKDLARTTWRQSGGSDETFIVVGEELSVPLDLVRQKRLDGLWNEDFKRILRNVILGHNDNEDPSFEWSVRKMIDCRLIGFEDGAQAVNYVGSHDVEGFRNERLFNFLKNNGLVFTEERIKLAFACLLTAVGIPMILAGDEFADQHDLTVSHPPKQRDAVNFDRLEEPFRRRVFDYVARLVKFRTSYPALWVNDTNFIHVDFNEGKRVVTWLRGRPGSDRHVVVVANFSDYVTPDAGSPYAEYRVPNWPATPPGMRWREITQQRDVPEEWVGREPIYAWEAKVYALVEK